MTPQQRAIAEAYSHVFAPGPYTHAVIDDMKTAANAMADPMQRAGATNMILHVLMKSSALRREKARG